MKRNGTDRKGGYSPMNDRTCEYCNGPIPDDARSDAVYCSPNHKRAARKRRRRREQIRASLVTIALPLDSHASDDAARAADERFRVMIQADEARRSPKTQERGWAAYARRHGTIHPGEQRARVARGQQDRLADWQQGTERFTRSTSTIGEAGRMTRAQQGRATRADDDSARNDPELREAPQMIDGPRRSR